MSQYVYDAEGKRVKRIAQGQEVWQVYGLEGELLAEYTSAGTAAPKEYGYRDGQLLITASPNLDAQAQSSMVVHLYQTILNRTPSTGEVQYWLNQGLTNVDAFKSVARQMFDSQEYTNRQRTNRQFVYDCYEAYLYREPDQGGWDFWTGLVPSQGRVNIRENGFASSQEFADRVARTLAGETLWLTADQLGTPRIINDASGSLANIKRHDYLPFGEELQADIGGRTTAQGYSQADNVRQKFAGYERDNETGLDFAQARYYSNVQGRFTSVDPIMITKKRLADPQSINLYAYTRNNPLKYVDPTGEYFVGTNGKRVGFKINDKGKIVLGKNASADLVRQARLINQTGSETALAQFSASATNETKNHFRIESKEVNNGLLGLQQAHDKNGKPLNWEAGTGGTGKFDGQPAYIKDKNGNMVYKEATITVFEGNITRDQLEAQQRINGDPALTKSEVVVGVFSHEVDHNTNQEAIDAIRTRQEGGTNNLDVEQPAEAVERQVFEEIKKKRP